MTSIKVEYTDNYREIKIPMTESKTFHAEYGVKKDGSLKDLNDSFNEDINNIFENLIGKCLTDNSCYDISLKIMKYVPFHDKVKMIFDHHKKELEKEIKEIDCYINYPDVSDLSMEGNKLKDLQRLIFLYDDNVWDKYSSDGYYKLSEQLRQKRHLFQNDDDYFNWSGYYIMEYNTHMAEIKNYASVLFEIIVYFFLL